ncbi:hypothetical protein AB1Y20_011492 [Prymnesium parvum]|uniref:ceramidase n=1 Tax=Prymnesium parvum TaxID=97485 RepID=A0AB34IHK8_PRYPA
MIANTNCDEFVRTHSAVTRNAFRDMSARLLFALAALHLPAAAARDAVPTYTIDLDAPPQARYLHLLPAFNATVWAFWDRYFARDKLLADALFLLTDIRGKEPPEMQAEIDGLAAASRLPLKFVQGIQMLYELQTVMVPVVNLSLAIPHALAALNRSSADTKPRGWDALFERLPWRGPGCTGIIAFNSDDGTVNHARNLDFTPVEFMKPLTYTAVYTKGGKELYRAQTMAGYTQAVTGLRRGADGFAVERNTRFTDHLGGNEQMLRNLLGGRTLNGWSVRQTLEMCADYACAVAKLSSVPYVSTEYAIVSGVRKGTILSRSPDGVAFTQTLGQPNYDERADYIIMTNFDFFWRDLREWFDPTGGRLFRPRRLVAQKLLNASKVLTPQVLFDTINAEGVIADTVFQALINVEKDIWNVSQPDLKSK